MKTRRKILNGIIALISLIAVLAVGLFVWAQQPTQFTISITGRSGLAFNGVIKADGAVMSVSGVVPAHYVVTARSVDCRLQKQQVGGPLGVRVRMRRHGGTCAVTTSDSGRGVYAFLSLHKGVCYTF